MSCSFSSSLKGIEMDTIQKLMQNIALQSVLMDLIHTGHQIT